MATSSSSHLYDGESSSHSTPAAGKASSSPRVQSLSPEHDEDLTDTQKDLTVQQILRKVDFRLCTIAGILCSLNLLDSGIISSAAVTSMPEDLNLTGDRFSVAIFIFTIASIVCSAPATILCRMLGPPVFFSLATISFGLITMCTAWVTSWRQMVALRVLLGMSMSGIYPSLTYLISTWYKRKEQQLRFAFLQSGEVIILATGSVVNFGLNRLDGRQGLRGWQWMFLVQGSITIFIGLITYFWIPTFPENSIKVRYFLSEAEIETVLARIDRDRSDAGRPEPFSMRAILVHFLDPKLYAFAVLFFLLNIVSTALSYFLPTILQSGMGFNENQAILLSAPVYYYAVLPVVMTSFVGDKLRLRGPIITFNAVCLIVGFCMLGFPRQVTVRYVGAFLATGAYVSNWAGLSAFMANNITGQWKRATISAAVAACNGLGGIAGSYIVRSKEAPRYMTAIWISIGSHILMIGVVAVCSFFFWRANRRASRGTGVIEGVVGFRYTY